MVQATAGWRATSLASRPSARRRAAAARPCASSCSASSPPQPPSGEGSAWSRATAGWAAACADGARLRGDLRVAATAVPLFAAVGTAGTALPLITSAVASFIKLYLLLLFVRVLLTWFPHVDWMGQPWVTLRQIDFTPIFGFMVLQFLVSVLVADDIFSV